MVTTSLVTAPLIIVSPITKPLSVSGSSAPVLMMNPSPALLALTCCLLLGPGPALSRGRWDHHPQRRPVTRTVTTPTTSAPVTRAQKSWNHRLGWSVPPERCQIPSEARRLGGQTLNSYYIDHVSDLLVQDKTLVSPIVFEGAMVSRTNTYKNLYFVSFKVFRVLKGKIHQQLQGQLRLLFRTEPGQRSGGSRGPRGCQPVPFGVRSGRRYLVFARGLRAPGRYIAVARPEPVRRKSLREVKHILTCRQCGKLILDTNLQRCTAGQVSRKSKHLKKHPGVCNQEVI